MNQVNQNNNKDVFNVLGNFIDSLLLEHGVRKNDADYKEKKQELAIKIESKIYEIFLAHVPEEKRAELTQLGEMMGQSKFKDFLKTNKVPNLDQEVQQMLDEFRNSYLK